jgi:hypothetical protein
MNSFHPWQPEAGRSEGALSKQVAGQLLFPRARIMNAAPSAIKIGVTHCNPIPATLFRLRTATTAAARINMNPIRRRVVGVKSLFLCRMLPDAAGRFEHSNF